MLYYVNSNKKELNMSRMSTLHLEIQVMLERGSHPAMVCKILGCSLDQVYQVLEFLEETSPYATINS